MDQHAMIEQLRWSSQVYLWLAIGVPILGAIAGGLLNMKRQHVEGQLRELKEQLTQAELHTLHTRSQDLQQHVTEARQQQAAAEQALRNVQDQQRPRTLTVAQFFSLLPQLHNGPKGTVKIGSPVGDAEAERFADLFYGVLATAGWTTERSRILQLGEPPLGLKLDVGRADMAPHGEFLRQILQGIGLEVSYTSDQDVPEGIMLFTVGPKPWPRN